MALAALTYIFINQLMSSHETIAVSEHSQRNSAFTIKQEDVASNMLFIKEREEQKLKVEQEKERLEQQKLEERKRLEEEKRKVERKAAEQKQQEQKQQEKKQQDQQQVQKKPSENQTSTKQEDDKTTSTKPKEKNKPKTAAPYPGLSSYAREVVRLTNMERAKHGLPELKLDEKLSEVAWHKSYDMVHKEYFSNQSPTYGSPFDMMRQFGITYTMAGKTLLMVIQHQKKSLKDG